MNRWISYLLGGSLVISPVSVGAGENMTVVMKRAENKSLIQFTDLNQKNNALKAAYGHFLPFDKFTITRDGKIVKLTDEIIDEIIKKGYRSDEVEGLPIASRLDSMLTHGEDFYIAAREGSFRLVVENNDLVGVTDDPPKTSFTDLTINNRTGKYFRKIAELRNHVATEGYHFFNDVGSINITIKGPKPLVTGIISDRLGMLIKTNSSEDAVRDLASYIGLYNILERGFARFKEEIKEDLSIDSVTNLSLTKKEGGFDYNLEITNGEGKRTTTRGEILEDSFWRAQKINKPYEDQTRESLGLETMVALAETSSGIQRDSAEADSSRDLGISVVASVGHPFTFTGGLRKDIGNFFVEGYGGAGKYGDEIDETFTGDVAPNGRRMDIHSVSDEDITNIIAGANFGYRFRSGNFSFSFGPFYSIERLRGVSTSVGKEYLDGDFLRNKDSQNFLNEGSRKRFGGSGSFGYKNISAQVGYDKRFRFGVKGEFPLKIPGRKK